MIPADEAKKVFIGLCFGIASVSIIGIISAIAESLNRRERKPLTMKAVPVEKIEELVRRWRWAAGLKSHMPESKAQQNGWNQCADELEAAAAVDVPVALTAKDCICQTVSSGPEYSLQISPNCRWHNRTVEAQGKPDAPKGEK